MKKFLLLVSMIIGLIPIAFAADISKQASKKECNRLYVAHANQAEVQPKGNKAILILKGVAPQIHYFCDRPVREFGNEQLQHFVDSWNVGKDSFKADHPNAVIVADLAGQEGNSVKQYNKDVILANPIYDARTQQLVFDIFVLKNNEKFEAINISNPNLFIDNCVLC